MAKLVVVTGSSAGVGRATAREFARRGYRVGLLARGAARLEDARRELEGLGASVCPVSADVADADAVEAAAARITGALGPIDVWVNNAMATIFAPVHDITPDEFRRATEVTYLGTVNGTMAALRRMRARNRGSIVNVGSALSYRAIPLQSAYCGAKYAIRGFTDSLRSELLHERLNVHLTMVHLAAMNTPQFDWARSKMVRRAQPVPPIYQPEVAARAIFFAATHRRREVWVGWPTVRAILANRVAPGLLDHYLAHAGYRGQLSDERQPADAPDNLFTTVDNHFGAHGHFDAQARNRSWEMWTSRHRDAVMGAAMLLGLMGLGALVRGRRN
ncbi:MAG: SDR family oxidoreductase [Acidisphaera sp.]|nr:SDR family oxidoreductase [Acidisphaera sp.]